MQIISWGINTEFTTKKPNVRDAKLAKIVSPSHWGHHFTSLSLKAGTINLLRSWFYMRVNKNVKFSLKKNVTAVRRPRKRVSALKYSNAEWENNIQIAHIYTKNILCLLEKYT